MILGTRSSLTIIVPMKTELVVIHYNLCCSCLCSVSLPRGSVCLSEAMDCDMSWSLSLTFFMSLRRHLNKSTLCCVIEEYKNLS